MTTLDHRTVEIRPDLQAVRPDPADQAAAALEWLEARLAGNADSRSCAPLPIDRTLAHRFRP